MNAPHLISMKVSGCFCFTWHDAAIGACMCKSGGGVTVKVRMQEKRWRGKGGPAEGGSDVAGETELGSPDFHPYCASAKPRSH